jgi:hypothetical protein
VHVIPTNDMGQLSFANAAMSVERSSLESAAAAIRHALRAAGHDTEVVG